jgi:hypothetical protein
MKQFGTLSLVIVLLSVVLVGAIFVPREGFFAAPPPRFASVGGAGKQCAADEVRITYGNRNTPVVYCVKKGNYPDTRWAWTYGDNFDCTIEIPFKTKIETYQGPNFGNLGFSETGPQSKNIRCFRNANSIKVLPA